MICRDLLSTQDGKNELAELEIWEEAEDGGAECYNS